MQGCSRDDCSHERNFSARYDGIACKVGPGSPVENQEELHHFSCKYGTLFLGILACYVLSYPGHAKTVAAMLGVAAYKIHVNGEMVALWATFTCLGKNSSCHHGGPHPDHNHHALREHMRGPWSCGPVQPAWLAALTISPLPLL